MADRVRRYQLEGINLKDPYLFELGVPHELFKKLRREAPIYWNPELEPEEPGFWALTKYEDIVTVSRNPELFSSMRGGHQISYPRGVQFNRATAAILGNMVAMDPPDHNVYRRLVAPSLSAAAVRSMEPKIRATVTRILDRIVPLGKCEFIKEVAAELPVTVLSDLLGVPAEDRHLLFEWTNVLTEMTTDIISGLAAFNQMITYGQRMFEKLRVQPPGEDLLSIVAHARVGGAPIDQQFLDGFFLLILIAGNETTRNAISGGTLALIEHPDQRDLLRANLELLPSAVEEILRWVTPVIHFRRTATADTELRGQTIHEGDKVVMWYPSANRDEEVFEEPGRFDIRRAPNQHLAFGEGEHFCLGAWLARLELRVLFEELIQRMPEVRLDGKIKRLRSYFLSGITHMPVAFG